MICADQPPAPLLIRYVSACEAKKANCSLLLRGVPAYSVSEDISVCETSVSSEGDVGSVCSEGAAVCTAVSAQKLQSAKSLQPYGSLLSVLSGQQAEDHTKKQASPIQAKQLITLFFSSPAPYLEPVPDPEPLNSATALS